MKRISLVLFYVLIILFVCPILSESSLYYEGNISLVRDAIWSANLTGFIKSSLAFGDVDNDGDLDIISSGCTTSGVTECTVADKIRIYINNGTSFVESSVWNQNLPSLGYGSLSFGDIDNDGDLDLIVMGDTGGGNGIVKIYTNDGLTLTENDTWGQNLIDVDAFAGTVVFGDINNDGRLDVALIGAYPSSNNGIYLNNGTSLIKASEWITLPYVGHGDMASLALGDINNDNKLDLIFFGEFPGNFYMGIYLNNGTNLVKNSTWEGDIPNDWGDSSFAFGDYDNDGDLDIVIMGTGGYGDKLRVYNNTGNNFVQQQHVSSFYDGSVAWGDYDNDGDLDLAAMGMEEGKNMIANNNGTYFQFDNIARADLREDDMQQGSLAWTNIDNNGALDLACSGLKYGNGYLTKIYISNSTVLNNNPSPPTINFNNTFNFSTGKLTLSWGNGSDAETPTLGLYYNLRVGTCSGCHDVVSGVYGGSSNPTAGYFGNMMQRKRIVLNRLDLENKTIYWVVQIIDTGLAKSAWSQEQIFHVIQNQICMENWIYGEWGSCSNGQQSRSATDLNNCSTFVNRSVVIQSCSIGPSAPGGSNGPSGPITPQEEKPKRPENVTGYLEKIEPGVDTGIIVNESGLSVNQIWMKVKSRVNDVVINIKKLISIPSFIEKEPEGKIYQYLNITNINLTDANIETGKILFKMNNSWFESNKINKSSILLNRYFSSSWQKLKTEFRSEDSEFAYYLAETPGFSIFAISGNVLEENKIICVPNETRCSDRAVEECSASGTTWTEREKCANFCENNKCAERQPQLGFVENYLWLLVIAAVIIIAAISALIKIIKIKKQQRIGAN